MLINSLRIKNLIIKVFEKYVGWPLHSVETWESMSNSLARKMRSKFDVTIQVEITVRFIYVDNKRNIEITWALNSGESSFLIQETLIIR